MEAAPRFWVEFRYHRDKENPLRDPPRVAIFEEEDSDKASARQAEILAAVRERRDREWLRSQGFAEGFMEEPNPRIFQVRAPRKDRKSITALSSPAI